MVSSCKHVHVFSAMGLDMANLLMPVIKLLSEAVVGGVSTLLDIAKLLEVIREEGPLELSDNSGVESPKTPDPDCGFFFPFCKPFDAAFRMLCVLWIRDICNRGFVLGLEDALCSGLEIGCELNICTSRSRRDACRCGTLIPCR